MANTDEMKGLIWIEEAKVVYGKSRDWLEKHFEAVTVFGDRKKYLRRMDLDARLGLSHPTGRNRQEKEDL